MKRKTNTITESQISSDLFSAHNSTLRSFLQNPARIKFVQHSKSMCLLCRSCLICFLFKFSHTKQATASNLHVNTFKQQATRLALLWQRPAWSAKTRISWRSVAAVAVAVIIIIAAAAAAGVVVVVVVVVVGVVVVVVVVVEEEEEEVVVIIIIIVVVCQLNTTKFTLDQIWYVGRFSPWVI